MQKMDDSEARQYLSEVRHSMAGKGLRLGQAILNDCPEIGPCPEVYYSENEGQVIEWFRANLVGKGTVSLPMDTSMMRFASRLT